MNRDQTNNTRNAPRREPVVPEDMKNIPEKFYYSPGVKAGRTECYAGL